MYKPIFEYMSLDDFLDHFHYKIAFLKYLNTKIEDFVFHYGIIARPTSLSQIKVQYEQPRERL